MTRPDRDNIRDRIQELERKPTLTPAQWIELWELQEEADRAEEAEEREHDRREWEGERVATFNRGYG